MRAHEKKKIFRLMCKQQVQSGKMPNAEGVWITQTGTAGQHILAGHGKRR